MTNCYIYNMLTVPAVVERVVKESPLLEEALAAGLINLSALARKIRPAVSAELEKKVSDAALLMALKRLTPKLTDRGSQTRKILKSMGDMTVRSSLTEFTFLNSATILESQKRLLHHSAVSHDQFMTFTQGVFETTVIVSSSLEKVVKQVFVREKMISRVGELSAITLRLPAKSISTPGIHYAIMKQLAWDNINVVEVVSTYTEFTMILEKKQVDRAFTKLKSYLWR